MITWTFLGWKKRWVRDVGTPLDRFSLECCPDVTWIKFKGGWSKCSITTKFDGNPTECNESRCFVLCPLCWWTLRLTGFTVFAVLLTHVTWKQINLLPDNFSTFLLLLAAPVDVFQPVFCKNYNSVDNRTLWLSVINIIDSTSELCGKNVSWKNIVIQYLTTVCALW